MLKSYLSGGVTMLVLGPSLAMAQAPSPFVQNADNSPMPYQMSMDGMGPRAPGKLRDVLRQTGDTSSISAQPYRLTPEERQRLREQLRQQPWPAQPGR